MLPFSSLLFFCFETVSHYVALAFLVLTLYIRLARSKCTTMTGKSEVLKCIMGWAVFMACLTWSLYYGLELLQWGNVVKSTPTSQMSPESSAWSRESLKDTMSQNGRKMLAVEAKCPKAAAPVILSFNPDKCRTQLSASSDGFWQMTMEFSKLNHPASTRAASTSIVPSLLEQMNN